MSRGGGAAGGWTWWPPSRRRQQQQQQPGSRREAALGGEGPAELGWALCAAALLLLLLLLLWLLGAAAALGLCGAGLFLAAGAAWAADLASAPDGARRGAPQRLGPRRGAPSPRERPLPGESAVANGGPGLLALRENKSGGRPRFLGGNHLAPPAHFVLPLRRRYPIHQAQYASLGTLPSICWDGYRQKNRLSTRNSGLVQSPVTVKIARPDNSFGRSPLLEQLSSPGSFSPAPHDDTPDLCAREAVLSALKQSRKRAMMEEEEEEEEEEENHRQSLLSGQESKRRRHGSSSSGGQSVFEPLVANGVPASLVPKPGSLKRGLLSHGLEDLASKRSRFSSLSSTSSLCVGGIPSSLRNAIASSYSSSRGLSQLWKRSGQSASPFSSPASSRSQTPERPSKKARSLDASLTEEEAPQGGASMPVEADQEVPAEQTAETPVARHRALGSPSSSGSNRKRRRKIQLLSTWREDRFALPPPPQLGYSATSEDLDADKKVTLQRFNKVLEEKADSTPDPPVETTSVPSALPFPLLAAPSSISAPGTNPLLESLRKMQGEQSCPAQADAAAAAEASRPLTPAASLDLSSSAPVTTPEAKPLALAVPAPLAVAAPSPADVEPAGGASSLAAMSESGPAPARPSSVPQPSLLGLLVSPAAGQPAVAVTAASSLPSAMPVLKAAFGSLAKPEGPPALASFHSGAPGTAASSPAPPGVVPTLGAACGPPSSTFKPIFGAPPPATTALPSAAATTASLFTFKQSPQLAPACSLPSSAPPSGASGLPGLLEAIVAPAASSSATASATPACASKPPVFSFGLGVPAVPSSTAAATTTTTTAASAAQPFLFGALPSSTTAPGTATAPVFQFGKAAAVAAAPESALNPFGQVPPSSSSSTAAGPHPPTAASFSVFGSGAPASAATTPQQQQQQQPAMPLTFGSCPSAFSAAFGSPSKPPPPYRAGASQLTLEAGAPDGQQPATKPGPGAPMSFGAPFSFAGSVAQPAAQSVFGGSASGGSSQAPFGGSGPLASFGTKSTAQPAFGAATSSVFSFGTTATTSAASGFGANTQTTSSGAGGGSSVFGSSGSGGPSSFSFGASGQPAAAGSSAFGPRAAVGGSVGGPAVGFSFGSGQGAAAGAAAPPFGSPLAQPPLGSQSPFAFSIPGATPEGKPAFGGAPTPTFGQGLPAPGGGTAGSPLSFGAPLTPAFGGAGSTFGPATPSFSIGAGSKMGGRQRLQARRHTARKK